MSGLFLLWPSVERSTKEKMRLHREALTERGYTEKEIPQGPDIHPYKARMTEEHF